MEKIYTKKKNNSKIIAASPETVDFLLAYSKSLEITKVKGITFESNLN